MNAQHTQVGRFFMRVLLLTVVSWFAFAASVGAQPQQDLDAQIRMLAQHPYWLRLLHFDSAGRQSEIVSPDFFLSPQGRFDAGAELQATLQAYVAPWPDDPNQHARCRFPARYEWLARQRHLPDYALRERRCSKLERWALFDRLESVSLFLVSGYFGNPASSFGHALLRLNTGDAVDSLQLLDLAFNFGALVPENELIAVYVYRGLTGGYAAGFSDRYFYTQDLVYARTEFRDMWDYRLELSTEERHRLVLHLWEVVGKKFTYYFLTKNCAYRLAELIEWVTGVELTSGSSVWFTPVELFHRLEDARHERSMPLVQSVRFVPSSQRVMQRQFALLQPNERAVAHRVIEEGVGTLHQHLAQVDADSRTGVLDALLAYFQYRVVAQMPHPSVDLREQKDALLRARLQLAVADAPVAAPIEVISPAKGSAPMLLGAGIGGERERNGRSVGVVGSLRWAAYSNDVLGRHGIENGELVVMDTSVDIQRGANVQRGASAVLDKVDVIRVRRLNVSSDSKLDDSALSWHVRVGAERRVLDRASERAQTYAFGHFGAGSAAVLLGSAAQAPLQVTGWAMVDGVIRSGGGWAAAQPNVGLLARRGPWSVQAQGSRRYEFKSKQWQSHWLFEANYMLNPHRSIRVETRRDGAVRAMLGIRQYL